MDRSTDGWEEFRKLWDDFLQRANDDSTVVVVEGEKDRRSLKRLGVTGRVVLLHSGRGLSQLTRSLMISGQRIVVLTDWDREGGHLAHRLTELLAAEGNLVDAEFRRRLARVLRGEVVHVEGLAGWARRTAERAGAPLDHWFGVDGP
ncbi:MAG: toprim domain-containing protein [Thermoplasmata archaeon]|nr:toprim domain-containing protein [Thermoplasmata archaeon]